VVNTSTSSLMSSKNVGARSQYTSKDFAELARNNGVVLSVGRKGECWDNAVAESFSQPSSASSSTPARGQRDQACAAQCSSTSRAGFYMRVIHHPAPHSDEHH